MTSALDEMKMIEVSPGLDIFLADQIHRPDQFHSFKVLAVQFRHHRLDLTGPEYRHQYGFDHIIIMMSERNLIAAKFLRLPVQVSPPHPCAQIAGRFLYLIDRVENPGLKDGDRNSQHGCVILDHKTIQLVVARVHHQVHKFKRKLILPVQFLKELRHKHGVLAARDTDSDLISRLYQFILLDRLCEAAEQPLPENPSLDDGLLDLPRAVFMAHGHRTKPRPVAIPQTEGVIPHLPQF